MENNKTGRSYLRELRELAEANPEMTEQELAALLPVTLTIMPKEPSEEQK